MVTVGFHKMRVLTTVKCEAKTSLDGVVRQKLRRPAE